MVVFFFSAQLEKDEGVMWEWGILPPGQSSQCLLWGAKRQHMLQQSGTFYYYNFSRLSSRPFEEILR